MQVFHSCMCRVNAPSLNLQVDGEGNSNSDSDWLFKEGSSGIEV